MTLFLATLAAMAIGGFDEMSPEEASAPMTMAFVVMALGTVFSGVVMRRSPETGLTPPIAGRWLSPSIDRVEGAYVQRGQQIGMVASDEVVVLAVVKQDASDRAYQELVVGDEAEIKLKGRADLELTGRIVRVVEADPQRSAQVPGLGVAFEEVSEDKRKMLREFLKDFALLESSKALPEDGQEKSE